MTSMLKSLKNVFGNQKDDKKNIKEQTDSSNNLTEGVEKPISQITIEKINNSEIPTNIFAVNGKDSDVEKFDHAEEIIENILSFMLSSNESNAKELLLLSGVNTTWMKITEDDKYWKPTVTFFQLGYPDVELDSKLSGKLQYYTILSKADPEKFPPKSGAKKDTKKQMTKSISKPPAPVDPVEYYPVAIDTLTYREAGPDSIIWEEVDGKKKIEAATLNKLIEELTSHEYFDQHFLHTFMITFRSFTERDTFFDLLVERYNIPPPAGCTHEEFAKFKTEKLDRIRLRVTQTIKYWIESFYVYDFDEEMKAKVEDLMTMMDKIKGGPAHKKILLNSLGKVQGEVDSGTIQSDLKCPPIEKPKTTFKLFGKKDKNPVNPILLWPSIEIARQITLIDFDQFKLIEPKECLNQSWNKGNRETRAPNINSMIQTFNTLSNWIGTTIVQVSDLKERAKTVERFIEVAQNLWDLNNFNGVFAVCSGLSLASIYRLKKTWNEIREESKTTFQQLHKYISRDKNFAAIRGRLKGVKPPCIPYIGLYLTDLTFIEDGNPKYINGKINFVKCQHFAGVIRDMQTYQQTRYAFLPAEELQKCLLNLEYINETEMYDQSVIIEPKEKKKTAKKKTTVGNSEETSSPAKQNELD